MTTFLFVAFDWVCVADMWLVGYVIEMSLDVCAQDRVTSPIATQDLKGAFDVAIA
jgi:hypothetical protein